MLLRGEWGDACCAAESYLSCRLDEHISFHVRHPWKQSLQDLHSAPLFEDLEIVFHFSRFRGGLERSQAGMFVLVILDRALDVVLACSADEGIWRRLART
jgi:hypothetical protein